MEARRRAAAERRRQRILEGSNDRLRVVSAPPENRAKPVDSGAAGDAPPLPTLSKNATALTSSGSSAGGGGDAPKSKLLERQRAAAARRRKAAAASAAAAPSNADEEKEPNIDDAPLLSTTRAETAPARINEAESIAAGLYAPPPPRSELLRVESVTDIRRRKIKERKAEKAKEDGNPLSDTSAGGIELDIPPAEPRRWCARFTGPQLLQLLHVLLLISIAVAFAVARSTLHKAEMLKSEEEAQAGGGDGGGGGGGGGDGGDSSPSTVASLVLSVATSSTTQLLVTLRIVMWQLRSRLTGGGSRGGGGGGGGGAALTLTNLWAFAKEVGSFGDDLAVFIVAAVLAIVAEGGVRSFSGPLVPPATAP